MIYFDALTCGFYFQEIHGENIPSDAVEITPEQHAALLQGQSEGKVITTDENGYPVLSDPIITQEDLEVSERIWRDAELNRSDIELNKVQDSDPKAKGSVSDWRTYRKELRAWPENENFPDSSKRPVAPDAE